jgi:hypothetical protein
VRSAHLKIVVLRLTETLGHCTAENWCAIGEHLQPKWHPRLAAFGRKGQLQDGGKDKKCLAELDHLRGERLFLIEEIARR